MRTFLGVCLAITGTLAVAACGSSGEGGREIHITQTDEGCTPTSIEATAGEKLNLVVKNDSGGDYEIEGIDGAKLEEVVVPEGRTRSMGYDVPGSGGVTKLKCYFPGGPSTIIEVKAGEGSGVAEDEEGAKPSAASAEEADSSVTVTLAEYTVEPDTDSVSAGKIRFTATNSGEQIHELYVLKTKDAGYDVAGEIENVDPGKSGAMTLDLAAGEYTLACLIASGEAGSSVDHFEEGMYTPFTVE
jgi:uncharacterized cupredoxin-like copper-binding protein